MIDAIVYIADFPALVAYMNEHAPERLLSDESGELVLPPVITGFSRTPAVVNGDSMMAYARFRNAEADEWRATPGVDVLAEAPSEGPGTADAVYHQVFDNADKLSIYDSVYERFEEKEDPETGEVSVVERPRFGVMAGA